MFTSTSMGGNVDGGVTTPAQVFMSATVPLNTFSSTADPPVPHREGKPVHEYWCKFHVLPCDPVVRFTDILGIPAVDG